MRDAATYKPERFCESVSESEGPSETGDVLRRGTRTFGKAPLATLVKQLAENPS